MRRLLGVRRRHAPRYSEKKRPQHERVFVHRTGVVRMRAWRDESAAADGGSWRSDGGSSAGPTAEADEPIFVAAVNARFDRCEGRTLSEHGGSMSFGRFTAPIGARCL